LEAELIHKLAGDAAADLSEISWEDIGDEVWLPIWRARVHEHGDRLRGVHPGDATGAATSPTHLAEKLGFVDLGGASAEEIKYRAAMIFGSALCVMLVDRGWTPNVVPGAEVSFQRDGLAIRPFHVPYDIAEGRLLPSEWLALCEQAGIADVDLGAGSPT
jgi:hypothetical protein